MLIIEALKDLAVKLGCAESVASVTGDTTPDVIKFISDNAPESGTNLKQVDIDFTDISPENWSQSTSGMYYLDGATYSSLGLSNITPLALTTVDWSGISNSFAPYMASNCVGLTCSTNMEIDLIKVRLLYVEN